MRSHTDSPHGNTAAGAVVVSVLGRAMPEKRSWTPVRGKRLAGAGCTLLRLNVVCPTCEVRPRVQATEATANRYQSADPAEDAHSYQCHNCGTVYIVPAEAYQRARAA